MARMNRPAPVEVCYKNMRFLITHNPTNATLSTFLEVRREGWKRGPGPSCVFWGKNADEMQQWSAVGRHTPLVSQLPVASRDSGSSRCPLFGV